MENIVSLIPSLLLGVALSAASGFRVFIPLLISNLAVRGDVFHVTESFAWMGSTNATIVLAVASLLEIGAYYIPFVDNILDAISAPLAFVAGTLLTTSFLQIDDPILKWGLGIVAGGGVASTIQAGTSLLRLGSSQFTAGSGNNIVATIENGSSLLISLFSVWLPVITGVIMVFLVVWVIRRLARRFRSKEKAIEME